MSINGFQHFSLSHKKEIFSCKVSYSCKVPDSVMEKLLVQEGRGNETMLERDIASNCNLLEQNLFIKS